MVLGLFELILTHIFWTFETNCPRKLRTQYVYVFGHIIYLFGDKIEKKCAKGAAFGL